MNTNLIEKLIKEQNYCIDKITIDYDIIPCEYRLEITLCAENSETILFRREYIDDKDDVYDFGTDLKAIGEIFQNMVATEEAENE